MNDSTIEQFLYTYTTFILKFEAALKDKFNLLDIPYNSQKQMPRKGTFQYLDDTVQYRFHGSGCEFVWNLVKLDYNIYMDRSNYIVTSPWKLSCYVNSYLNGSVHVNEEETLAWLESLNERNIVKKVFDDYSVYEVDFEWYKRAVFQSPS